MKNIFKKVLSVFLFVGTSFYANAADIFLPLADATKTSVAPNDTYEWTNSSDWKANKSAIYVELPSANVSGTIAWKCSGNQSSRFLYINSNAGTQQDQSRPIVMSKTYVSISFSSSDITTYQGKPCLKFTTRDDFKGKGVLLTIPQGSTPAQKSDDATLKELKYDGTSVPNFDAKTLDYSVTLPANYSGVPNVTATANDSKATPNITQAASATGKATVLVTAEDGTTKKTYTIQFSQAAADEPVITSFVVAGVQATIDAANKTITATLPIGTSLTNLIPTVRGDNIASCTPQGAQDFTNPVRYTVTSASGKTATYTVTLQVEQPKSSDATLKTLTVGGKAITLQAGVYNYTVDAESGNAVPQVSATANDSKATIKFTQAASLTDKATVVVTAEDGSTQTYTITFNVKVPSSELSIHTPGVYEAIAGGYGGTLTVFGGREYEVYYAARNTDDLATLNTTGTDRTNGVTTNETATSCEATDGWFKGNIASVGSASAAAQDEFAQGTSGREHRMENGHAYTFHFSGYDQFSIYAKDKKKDSKGTKPGDNQYFEVYIDGIPQPLQFNKDSYTIRRYSISTGEHVVMVKAINGQCRFLGFSLRVADEPRVSWIKGNDSTQNVLQTRSIAPVTYYTKYNSKGKTVLEWEGAEATGISLAKGNSDGIGDTLTLSGTANCPVGIYTYKVVAYNQSNQVTNSLTGKITVSSKIEATSDTIQEGFINEAIDGFTFRYSALSSDAVTLTWINGTPAGITGSGNNGTYTISGTPTTAGTYPFIVSVLGGNSITGKLTITTFDPGNNPVLYLYSNTLAYEKDGVYLYLKSKGKNLVPRKAQEKLRDKEQYGKYTWVLISEDVDANNQEAISIARGDCSLPVLNMKAFLYTTSRLGWGYPDNGSIENTDITVLQPSHPVFRGMQVKEGTSLTLLSGVNDKKGLMPVKVDLGGTLALATAPRRGEDYYSEGAHETFLHEIPASLRQAKYILFPLGQTSGNLLTQAGKQLLGNIVTYLLEDNTVFALPELRISSFRINGENAVVNEAEQTITMTLPAGTDLTALQPEVTVVGTGTWVSPSSGETIDFSDQHYGVNYIVTDGINRKVYKVFVRTSTALDELLEEGLWFDGIILHNDNNVSVNIYDAAGRKLTMTNSSYSFDSLPAGLYIVQTPAGAMSVLH